MICSMARPVTQQFVEIVAEHLDRDIGTHPGDQFVEPHLDRLGEFIVVAGDLLHRLLQFGNQLGARLARIGPLAAVLEDDECVRDAGRHRIGGDLGGADLGEHFSTSGNSLMRASSAFLHPDRLRQAGSRDAQGVQRDVALIQVRNELRSKARC